MANELNIQLDPFLEAGLTLLAKVFNQAGAQQGSDAAMTESSTGFYTADFSLASIADGAYTVKFQTAAAFYGSGILNVKGNAEVILSTFDPASDAVTTDTASRDASKADVSDLATTASITALNNISTNDIDLRLNAYDAPTKAELDSAVAPLSTFDPESDVIENSFTHNDLMKIQTAALAGKVSGSPDGPILIKGVDGTTTRINATVDEDGNRTAVTLTP